MNAKRAYLEADTYGFNHFDHIDTYDVYYEILAMSDYYLDMTEEFK